ncbi:hypothetical protein B277_01454 [Janibacter hoylei PVAS-1]|uniref:Uncharacterized protein n=1 Tax=Janibacter hoylei PVAS-1 TaxID=1210046 RepID=K1EAN9_9MICO|nr:hypothetical protein B277_01454 [Janibacter hoylei PVAS-1]
MTAASPASSSRRATLSRIAPRSMSAHAERPTVDASLGRTEGVATDGRAVCGVEVSMGTQGV